MKKYLSIFLVGFLVLIVGLTVANNIIAGVSSSININSVSTTTAGVATLYGTLVSKDASCKVPLF